MPLGRKDGTYTRLWGLLVHCKGLIPGAGIPRDVGVPKAQVYGTAALARTVQVWPFREELPQIEKLETGMGCRSTNENRPSCALP